ncbi:MAG: hypothetical protein ACRDP4_15700, partial [Nocardioidaceae bacterium]
MTARLRVAVRTGSDPTLLRTDPVPAELAARALADLSEAGIGLSDFNLGQPSLHDVFLALTGVPATSDKSALEPTS